MITHHTQLLNALIEKYGYKSYLEIGVQNPANNFNKINIHSRMKFGCDPEVHGLHIFKMSSDEFFATMVSDFKFDLIFIDGDHTKEQVKRDFENSLRCLSPNGRIVIHDVLPENETGTIVPRQTKQWWGDVYKWGMNIGQYQDISYITFNIDNGCMVVWRSEEKRPYRRYATSWDWYQLGKYEAMNVTDVVEI